MAAPKTGHDWQLPRRRRNQPLGTCGLNSETATNPWHELAKPAESVRAAKEGWRRCPTRVNAKGLKRRRSTPGFQRARSQGWDQWRAHSDEGHEMVTNSQEAQTACTGTNPMPLTSNLRNPSRIDVFSVDHPRGDRCEQGGPSARSPTSQQPMRTG